MKQNLFSNLTPWFWVFSAKMGSKTFKVGPSTSEMGQKRVKLVQTRAKLGIFSTFWMFPERQEFFVGSVAHHF